MSGLYHPELPCGYAADAMAGDEFSGGGTNWPCRPIQFDSFEVLPVVVLTPPLLAGFDDCPDLIVSCQNDTFVVHPVNDTVIVRKAA